MLFWKLIGFLVLYAAYKTQVSRNENLAKLQAGYLFPEVCLNALILSLNFWDFIWCITLVLLTINAFLLSSKQQLIFLIYAW